MRRRTIAVIAALVAAVVAIALLAGKTHRRRSGDAAGSSTIAGASSTPSPPKPAPLDDPRTKPRAHIEGHIRDEAAKPIAGATVCASAWSALLGSLEVEQPTCTVSNEDGAYVIADLVAASYGVSASAPHRRPSWFYRERAADERDPLDLQKGGSATKIDITLKDGGVEVHGRVKDIGGGAIADAWVESGRTGSRSDANGDFTLWIAPGDVWINVLAEGYTDGSARGVAPGQTFEILLTPESVLVGRVIDATSRSPVEGVMVAEDESAMDGRGFSLRTDADGKFRIDHLKPGRYKPTALAHNRLGIASESVLLGLAETSKEVVIELVPASAVEGRVTIAGVKQVPCETGDVTLTDPARGHRVEASVDHGTVTFPAVLPGTYAPTVSCRGKR
jgi:hypothetical protein